MYSTTTITLKTFMFIHITTSLLLRIYTFIYKIQTTTRMRYHYCPLTEIILYIYVLHFLKHILPTVVCMCFLLFICNRMLLNTYTNSKATATTNKTCVFSFEITHTFNGFVLRPCSCF